MFFLLVFLCLLLPFRAKAQAIVTDKTVQQVIVSVHDQAIITPAFQGVPFCTGTVRVNNQTHFPIQFLEINLTYHNDKGHFVSVKKRFQNIPVQQNKQQALAFSGYICDKIFQLPTLNKITCLWDKDTEQNCQPTVVLKGPDLTKEEP